MMNDFSSKMQISEDKLRLNTALYGFDGIIGRRDFVLNAMYITAIAMLIGIPFGFWMSTNMTEMSDYFNMPKLFMQTPIWLKLWIISLGSVTLTLSISNIFRRLNDISGKVNTNLNIYMAIYFVINAIGTYMFPYALSCILGCITFVISMCLYFIPGKITSKYPYDFRKVFNWGAFFGTWIWGLVNKSYVTLWQLILFFTPWGFIFAIICGLKGNEWAYKNKKSDDVEKFNKSQRTQAAVFSTITLVAIPVLYFLFIIAIVGLIAVSASLNTSTSPCSVNTTEQNTPKIESNLDNFIKNMANLYFEKYTIEETENKFYVKNSDWKYAGFDEKKEMLELAATVAANERRNKQKSSSKKEHEYYSKTSELPKTKIYSFESGKLLGEFVLDENINNSTSFIDIVKSAIKAYKFYQPE